MIKIASGKRSLNEWRKIEEKIHLLESRVRSLEDERKWLTKELKETYKELEETYSELSKERMRRKNLEKILEDITKTPKLEKPKEHRYMSTVETLESSSHEVWKPNLVEESKKFLEKLKNKIEKREEPTKEELKKLVEIDILADKHPELKKLVREIVILLEKITSPEIVELKEGEIKEIDEDILIRKRKDGVIEIITL